MYMVHLSHLTKNSVVVIAATMLIFWVPYLSF